MPHSAMALPSPPIESDSCPATTRPTTEPSNEVTRSSAFDVPRTSVGKSSASIVPIESAAGAAATIAIVMKIQSQRRRRGRRRWCRAVPMSRLTTATGRRPRVSVMRPASRIPKRPGSPAVTARNAATPDDEKPRSSERNRFVNCADGALKTLVRKPTAASSQNRRR